MVVERFEEEKRKIERMHKLKENEHVKEKEKMLEGFKRTEDELEERLGNMERENGDVCDQFNNAIFSLNEEIKEKSEQNTQLHNQVSKIT